MGNAAARMGHEATTTAVGKRPKNSIEAAVPAGQCVAAARKKGEKVARPGRRGVEQQAGGGGAATLVTVKVVMTRKEAEKLIARLNEQSARERKARMAELKGQLRAGNGGGSPASCRDVSLDAEAGADSGELASSSSHRIHGTSWAPGSQAGIHKSLF